MWMRNRKTNKNNVISYVFNIRTFRKDLNTEMAANGYFPGTEDKTIK